MIAFVCVMAIHMELIDAILKVYGIEDRQIPVIRCPKCLSFQSVLWFLVFTGHNIIASLATAFLASYIAIWLDLCLGLMDMWYEDIIKRISEGEGTTEIHHKDHR